MFMELLVLPAAPGEEGKEGHGRGPAATWGERSGHGGAAEGRGRLPSPRRPDRAPSPTRGRGLGMQQAAASWGCTGPLNSFSCSRSAKLFKAWGGQAWARRGSPGCPESRGWRRGKKMLAWQCAVGDAGGMGSTQAWQPKKTPRPSSMQ